MLGQQDVSKIMLGPLSPYTWVATSPACAHSPSKGLITEQMHSWAGKQLLTWQKQSCVPIWPLIQGSCIKLWHFWWMSYGKLPCSTLRLTVVGCSLLELPSGTVNCPFSVIMVPVLCSYQVQYYDNWRLAVPSQYCSVSILREMLPGSIIPGSFTNSCQQLITLVTINVFVFSGAADLLTHTRLCQQCLLRVTCCDREAKVTPEHSVSQVWPRCGHSWRQWAATVSLLSFPVLEFHRSGCLSCSHSL